MGPESVNTSLKSQSLKQSKVYCKAHSRREVTHVLKSLEPPVGVQQSTFKSQVTEGVLQGL